MADCTCNKANLLAHTWSIHTYRKRKKGGRSHLFVFKHIPKNNQVTTTLLYMFSTRTYNIKQNDFSFSKFSLCGFMFWHVIECGKNFKTKKKSYNRKTNCCAMSICLPIIKNPATVIKNTYYIKPFVVEAFEI